MRCYEDSLDQFAKLLKTRIAYWPSSNTRFVLFAKFNCKYELMSLWTRAVLPHQHRSVAESIVWTNHIIEITLVHLHFRPQCVTQQFTFSHKHREVFLLSQVRDQHALDKIENLVWRYLALLLHLFEIYSGVLFFMFFLPSKALGSTIVSFFAWFTLKLASLAGSEIELALLLSYLIIIDNLGTI